MKEFIPWGKWIELHPLDDDKNFPGAVTEAKCIRFLNWVRSENPTIAGTDGSKPNSIIMSEKQYKQLTGEE